MHCNASCGLEGHKFSYFIFNVQKLTNKIQEKKNDRKSL